MEERRISRLYLANFTKSISSLFGAEFRRSRAFPLVILVIALGVPAALWYAHTHAYFHKTKEKIGDDQPQVVYSGPGGRAPLTLTHTPSPGGSTPELSSATVLPGLGLDIIQIAAALPGHGTTPLLVAPTDQELNDGEARRIGPNDVHGAIEVPWGGLLTGLRAIVGSSLLLDFHGNTFSVPLDDKGIPTAAEGGLLQTRNADTATVTPTPDGAVLNGTFSDTDFDGHWRSKSEVKVQVQLHGSALDLVTTVRNTGDEPEPMGIGWHPRFRLPGSHAATLLHLPQGEMLEMSDRSKELPSGHILAASDALSRYFGSAETLRDVTLDEALVRLKGASPSAELRFPSAGYGLRLTALSPSIQELRVFAPAGSDYVSFGFQTNLDDPLSHNWPASESPIVVLQPGQSMEYRVRLEIFPLGKG